jgi:hypothetical protein
MKHHSKEENHERKSEVAGFANIGTNDIVRSTMAGCTEVASTAPDERYSLNLREHAASLHPRVLSQRLRRLKSRRQFVNGLEVSQIRWIESTCYADARWWQGNCVSLWGCVNQAANHWKL